MRESLYDSRLKYYTSTLKYEKEKRIKYYRYIQKSLPHSTNLQNTTPRRVKSLSISIGVRGQHSVIHTVAIIVIIKNASGCGQRFHFVNCNRLFVGASLGETIYDSLRYRPETYLNVKSYRRTMLVNTAFTQRIC